MVNYEVNRLNIDGDIDMQMCGQTNLMTSSPDLDPLSGSTGFSWGNETISGQLHPKNFR